MSRTGLRGILLVVLFATFPAWAGPRAQSSDREISDRIDRIRPAVIRVTGLWADRNAVPSSGVYVGDAGIALSWGQYAKPGWRVKATLPGGEEREGRVLARDPRSGVVALALSGAVPAHVRAVGKDLRAGHTTLSAGHPFAAERADHWPATGLGIVAQYRPATEELTEGRYLLTLAVNPGEFGGPLLAGDGRLAGILLPVRDGRSDFHQAVPVSDLRRAFRKYPRVMAALAPHPAAGPSEARAWPVHAALRQAALRVAPSVVSLIVTRKPADRIASGLLVDREGHILTAGVNLHRAEQVVVVLPGGREAPAVTIATDERYDLALLRIPAEGLPAPADLATEPMQVGRWVAAVGNPNGRATGRGPLLSVGIVGALDRPDRRFRAIHTDAGINRANAGGALVDLDGRVVGVPTTLGGRAMSAFGSNSGLGFAIPAAVIRERLPTLRKGESLTYAPGYLGVELDTKSTTKDGVRITAITKDHAAERAGLRPEDVIQEIDGIPIRDMADVQWIFGGFEEGQQITVTVRRGKELVEMTATLGKRP